MTIKRLTAALAALLLAASAGATELNDTLLDLRDAHRVVLTEDSSRIDLQVFGRGADSTFRYDYNANYSENASSLVRSGSRGWDFSNIQLGKKRPGRWSTEFRMGGLGFGFVSGLGAPAGLDVDMASSYEIFADLVSFHRVSPDQHHDFSLGFGLDWRNFRMTGTNRFVKEGAAISVAPYPDGAEADFSRIKVFSLTFPFRYSYNFGSGRKWNVNVAAILKVNTYASLKTRYSLDGRDYKEFSKDIRQKPVSVDLMAGFGWKFLGVYVKYDPCRVLNKAFTPRFNALTTGLTFFF